METRPHGGPKRKVWERFFSRSPTKTICLLDVSVSCWFRQWRKRPDNEKREEKEGGFLREWPGKRGQNEGNDKVFNEFSPADPRDNQLFIGYHSDVLPLLVLEKESWKEGRKE